MKFTKKSIYTGGYAKEVAIEMLCFIVISAFTDLFTQCFIAGTLILTSLGLKKIEEIICTLNHRFYIEEKVWTESFEILENDEL